MKTSTKKALGITGGILGVGGLILALLFFWKRGAAAPYIPSCNDCDLNNDGYVTMADLSTLIAHWGEKGLPGWIKADVNRDGVIDEKDSDWLQHYWNQKC